MTNPVIHETDRLLLQSWELSDFDALAVIARDPKVMRYIADGTPWSDGRIGWFMGLQRAFQHSLGYCCWKLVDRETQEIIGFCGIAPVMTLDEVEIGWWLKPGHWHRGLAQEAAYAVRDAAFGRHGLDRLIARVYVDNAPSIRLIDKLGMRFVRHLEPGAPGAVAMFTQERGATT